MGPFTLQTRDPVLCLSSQLWRRLQGQPLLQRYMWRKKTERQSKKTLGKFCLLYPNSVILLEDDSSNHPQEETEENNFIEPEAPRTPQKPRSRASKPEPPSLPTPAPTKPPTETEDLQKNEVVNTQQMCTLPYNCLFWI